MGDVVDVGQGGGYEDVILVLAGEAGIGLEDDLLGGELLAVFFGDFNLFHLGLLASLTLAFGLLVGFLLGWLGSGC